MSSSNVQNMSANSRAMQTFTRPLVVGAMSYLSSMFILGNDVAMVKLPGVDVNVDISTYFGLLGFGASFGTETIANWVIPYIPQSGNAAQYEVALIRPVIHSALSYGVTRVIYPAFAESFGFAKVAGAAFISEFATDYTYNNFIAPML